MLRQIISDEKFTNIQQAQAGLTKLFKSAQETASFYRVMNNSEPLGVLIPNNVWEDLLEDMEALSSEKYKEEIKKSRLSQERSSLEEIKKEFGL
ncbi:MAG: hypothetical protein ABFQ62_01550 [Patescibacteria group bacterium]